MYIKVHKTYRDVIAVCDTHLVGKKFEEGEFQLDVRENFFLGDDLSELEAQEIMKEASERDATFNIIGKDSCNLAVKIGLISKESIKHIQGIPFSLVLA
jgi:hypothetical protein